MNPADLLRAVRSIALETPLVALDVVEVSPPYDNAETTVNAAHRVVLETMGGAGGQEAGAAGRGGHPARHPTRPGHPALPGRTGNLVPAGRFRQHLHRRRLAGRHHDDHA